MTDPWSEIRRIDPALAVRLERLVKDAAKVGTSAAQVAAALPRPVSVEQPPDQAATDPLGGVQRDNPDAVLAALVRASTALDRAQARRDALVVQATLIGVGAVLVGRAAGMSSTGVYKVLARMKRSARPGGDGVEPG